MALRSLVLPFALLFIFPFQVKAENCTDMAKQLQGLRREYHEYVTHPTLEKGDLTFEGITARLDKIVELKKKMRKASCKKIPPRPKFDSGAKAARP